MSDIPDSHTIEEFRAALLAVQRIVRRRHKVASVISEVLFLSLCLLGAQNGVISWKVLMLILALVVLLRVVLSRRKTRDKYIERDARNRTARYSAADLAGRILRGEIDGNEITDHTQLLLQWLVPELSDPSPVDTIERVMKSAEWYSGPPRSHFRESWSQFLAFSGLPLLLIISAAGGDDYVMLGTGIVFWLGFFDLWLYSEKWRSKAFIDYLQGEWEVPSKLVDDGENSENGEWGLVDQSAWLILLPMIVNQLEVDLERGRLNIPLLIVMCALIPVFSALTGWLTGMWVVAVVMLPAMLINAKMGHRYRSLIRDRLDASSLAIQLASGQLAAAEVRRRVPALLRPWMDFPQRPKAYADQFRADLWQAAFNLDWYLSPPRLYLRWYWIVVPLIIIYGLAILLGYEYFFLYPPVSVSPAVLGLVQLPILFLLIPAVIHVLRVNVWIPEFVAYLRRIVNE